MRDNASWLPLADCLAMRKLWSLFLITSVGCHRNHTGANVLEIISLSHLELSQGVQLVEVGLCVDGLLEGGEELLLEAEDLADVAEEGGHLGRVGQEQRVLLLGQGLQVGL